VSDRVRFVCNGVGVDVELEPGESLLSVLRERLGITSPKDGCSPQGQCGCCTVLVDGDARVSCVTPALRVEGRAVTTVEGIAASESRELAASMLATGGSQCGFCTSGILMRALATRAKGRDSHDAVSRALAAHVCRCTGYLTIFEALAREPVAKPPRDTTAAERRALLEGGVEQRVDERVPLGGAAFADDDAPRDALVAVPLPPGSTAESVEAAGTTWVLGDSLLGARARAGKVQGRRTTIDAAPPLEAPTAPSDGVALATSWVEPAYLEPDASWCLPGGSPASAAGNGGAFGGKVASIAPVAARELADRFGRAVRVVFSREDVVRLGPKRPPMAAIASARGTHVSIEGRAARGGLDAFLAPIAWPYRITVGERWEPVDLVGPAASPALRAAGLAERVVLVEAALDAARIGRAPLFANERVARAALDVCAPSPSGALAGARVHLDDGTGRVERVEVTVAAGDPLDTTVLRSYAIGAAHMALGWVLTEGLAVDPASGEVLDLTMRSFGVIPAGRTPTIAVRVLDDDGPPLGGSSDAVFAAVAAAAWNALSRVEGDRPISFPARGTRSARALRR